MVVRVVAFAADEVKISGQLYLPGDAGASPYPTVCICHGIPHGTPDINLAPDDGGYPALAERICREGFAVLTFRFRGVGDSGGNFDIMDWTRDLAAAVDYLWVLPDVDRSHLALVGFSGGAAVSVYIAAQDTRISSLAACACPAEFDSLKDGFAGGESIIDYYRGIGIIRDRDFPHSDQEWLDNFSLVSPIEYISGIAPRPLLLLHGSRDEVVDVSHAYRLYERASEPKKLVIIDGAGHRLRRDERALMVIINWLKAHCGGVSTPPESGR